MIKVEIQQDGEWVPLEGVEFVEFHVDPIALAEEFRAIRETMLRLAMALGPAMKALGESFQEVRDHVAAIEHVQARTPGRDRPAWQSPYGPPTRRH